MKTTITKFQEYRSACDGLFNSLGAVDAARDGCFFGASKSTMARHLMTLSERLETNDVSELLAVLRRIYGAVESEVAAGMPANGRNDLTEILVARCEV